MKSTMIKVLASVLAIMMCAAAFVACGKTEEPAATTTAATTTAATTEATTEATTAATTTAATTTTTAKTTTTTEATTAAPEAEAVKDGLIVFYEDFNSYANNDKTEDTLKAIKWTKLTKEANGVYSESDAEFKIVDGRLYWDNWDTEAEKVEGDTRVRGKDSYYQIDMLTTAYMTPIVAGKYTLQYDMEYTDAKEKARYAVIITECSDDGQCYNSFHFRVGGYGNNQCHFYGSWKTYDAFDPATDLYVASTATTEADFATKGTTIIWKLLGKHYDANVLAFVNVPVTIRQQWDPEMGHSAYMKTADMKDFVKVTEPSVNADGPMYVGGWDGCGVQFKIGATSDGFLDNIIIWTGWGEKPAGNAVTYKPAA